jgi:hypothetical protein
MATVKHAINENDFVGLLDAVGEWPVGTTGTVVSERGEWKLIEISDDQGVMLDLLSVPEPGLKLISKHDE